MAKGALFLFVGIVLCILGVVCGVAAAFGGINPLLLGPAYLFLIAGLAFAAFGVGLIARSILHRDSGRPRVRRVRIVVALAIVAALTLVVWHRVWLPARHRHAVDSRVIADVEQLVRQELARLGPDSEIYRRYGEFRSLEGSGFKGPNYTWQLITRLECNRRAVFANGTASVYIAVWGNGPLAIGIKLHPPESWVREHPGSKVVKRGEELWLESPGDSAPSTIEVGASHPEFTAD